MEDKLKELIGGQRDEIEVYNLDLDFNWDKISEGVSQKKEKKSNKRKMWFSIAASLVILLVAGSAYLGNTINNNMADTNIFSGNEELAEAQAYYTSEIGFRLTAAKKLANEEKVFSQIAELDNAFLELKKDLKDNTDNEEVVIAMMENYQLKLKILDRILIKLKKDQSKKKKTKDDEII